MAEQGLRLRKGVRETATDYRFDPLGLIVEKERPDAEKVLLVFGMTVRARPTWWPFASRSRLLPAGAGPAAIAVATVMAPATVTSVAFAASLIAVGGVLGSLPLIAVGVVATMVSVSLVIHEMGHVLAFRVVNPRGRAILASRGASASLTRFVLPWRKEIVVVAAGPCAPAILGIPLLPLSNSAWLPVAAWFAIALAHVVTVAVPLGDGANLRRAVRSRREDHRLTSTNT